jgi:phospholipase C
MLHRFWFCVLALGSALFLAGCQGLVPGAKSGPQQLTVTLSGAGNGTVTSSPAGINCPGTCSANLQGSQITLTATPGTGFGFGGWSGGCTGTSTTCTVSGNAVTATFVASLLSINHIIFLAQENRSFDHYFGALRQYWAQNGIADQPYDGLPQFDPAGDPNAGPAPSNPGCDPAFPYPPNLYCQINSNSPNVQSFHLQSTCLENPSPSWAEAHRDWNVHNPVAAQALLNGFVDSGANDGRQHVNNQGQFAPYFDLNGVRVMGYYDGNDLNYYYALASDFATSDRWFSPVLSRTPPNREYLIAGTSHGYAYPIGTNANDMTLIPSPPIFEILQQQGITWKIYVDPNGSACASNPVGTCLINLSYVQNFTYAKTIRSTPSLAANIVPISQFYTDAVNGTLPEVAQIEPASTAGLDEHPSDDDPVPGQTPCCSMQAGANFVSTLINAVMCGQNNAPPSSTCTPGPSWADSVFILTFDEPGGFYDHVPPPAVVNPDGVAPVDLFPNDPCYGNSNAGPNCDFNVDGYRVPLVVISPFSKMNFVSHQARDTTAILKLIETRFNLSSLTQRDAAQVGMDDPTTGFFDFTNAPFKTPPTNLPVQNEFGPSACFVNPPPTSP